MVYTDVVNLVSRPAGDFKENSQEMLWQNLSVLWNYRVKRRGGGSNCPPHCIRVKQNLVLGLQIGSSTYKITSGNIPSKFDSIRLQDEKSYTLILEMHIL